MEDTILILITIFSLLYLYKVIFKDSGCNCGNNNCKTKKKLKK